MIPSLISAVDTVDRISLERLFKAELESLSDLLQSQDIHVPPYSDNSFDQFQTQSLDFCKKALSNFSIYKNICESAIESGRSIRESSTLVWYALKTMGLRPCSDLFDKLNDSDIIEFYNGENIQAFRNFRFFEISSYTLGDIFNYRWDQLFSREDGISKELGKLGVDLFTNKYMNTIPAEVPEHYLQETFSNSRFQLKMKHRYFSPLFDTQNRIAAVVCTSRVEVLATKQPELSL